MLDLLAHLDINIYWHVADPIIADTSGELHGYKQGKMTNRQTTQIDIVKETVPRTSAA